MSHTMFLAGDLDDDDNCEVGAITTTGGKALKGVEAQGLYEITLREEFARMNELTGSLTLTSGVQARARIRASRTASRGPWCGSMTLWNAPRPFSGCTRA